MTATATAIDAVHQAHEAYVDAINSNDLSQFLSTVTDDIVFLAPGGEPVAGKEALGAWVGGYLSAFHTNWTKTTVEMVVTDDVAYEWYRYSVVDTPRDGGDPIHGAGNGLNIYRRSTDGTWRVARDIWASAS